MKVWGSHTWGGQTVTFTEGERQSHGGCNIHGVYVILGTAERTNGVTKKVSLSTPDFVFLRHSLRFGLNLRGSGLRLSG